MENGKSEFGPFWNFFGILWVGTQLIYMFAAMYRKQNYSLSVWTVVFQKGYFNPFFLSVFSFKKKNKQKKRRKKEPKDDDS